MAKFLITSNRLQLLYDNGEITATLKHLRDKHKIAISSLEYTLGVDPELVEKLNAFRRKRNLVTYDQAFATSEMKADELLTIAIELRNELDSWLRKTYPEMVE